MAAVFASPIRSRTSFTRAHQLCRFPHLDFYQGFLFGCLSSLFFDCCFCFSACCFRPFSLSFLPPLSPITSLLSCCPKHLLAAWFLSNRSRPIVEEHSFLRCKSTKAGLVCQEDYGFFPGFSLFLFAILPVYLYGYRKPIHSKSIAFIR